VFFADYLGFFVSLPMLLLHKQSLGVSWSTLAFRVTQETCSFAAGAFRSSVLQLGDAIQVGPHCGLGVLGVRTRHRAS